MTKVSPKLKFKINSTVLEDRTMEQAIDYARSRTQNSGKDCVLYVWQQNAWLLLGTYTQDDDKKLPDGQPKLTAAPVLPRNLQTVKK